MTANKLKPRLEGLLAEAQQINNEIDFDDDKEGELQEMVDGINRLISSIEA